MYKGHKVYVIAFNSSSFSNGKDMDIEIDDKKRLETEISGFTEIDDFMMVSEKWFDNAYQHKLETLVETGYTRGYAYYIWKPYFIYTFLEQHMVHDGDYVIYIDVGCSLNYAGQERLNDYLNMCEANRNGVFGFQLMSREGFSCVETRWTKADLADYVFRSYGIDYQPLIDSCWHSDQFCATSIIVQKRQESCKFMYEWMTLCNSSEGIEFLCDKPSMIPNFQDFTESRHDQSIFSLMAKIFNIAWVLDEECYEWKTPSELKGKTPILHHIKFIGGEYHE